MAYGLKHSSANCQPIRGESRLAERFLLCNSQRKQNLFATACAEQSRLHCWCCAAAARSGTCVFDDVSKANGIQQLAYCLGFNATLLSHPSSPQYTIGPSDTQWRSQTKFTERRRCHQKLLQHHDRVSLLPSHRPSVITFGNPEASLHPSRPSYNLRSPSLVEVYCSLQHPSSDLPTLSPSLGSGHTEQDVHAAAHSLLFSSLPPTSTFSS